MSDSFLAPLASLFAISDEQAMWRVQTENDGQAFARLVQRWRKPIVDLCTRMTGDAHRAEDLAQEIFAKIYAKRAEYQHQGKFSTYLWRIALNQCYDELRKIRRRRETSLSAGETEDGESLEIDIVSGAPEPPANLESRERSLEVRDALARLPELYRTVLVLRHYEGLKFREIAELLEIPEGTVKSRMTEALSQMAKLLKPEVTKGNQRNEICV
jgi:RNA polymerase sigma-70 factor (ECF subfamily)